MAERTKENESRELRTARRGGMGEKSSSVKGFDLGENLMQHRCIPCFAADASVVERDSGG